MHNRRPYRTRCGAFSLIELVIVVVIISILAAIAIPKMSRGTAGAADAALAEDLAALRRALDHYQAEHGGYPDVTMVYAALTEYSTDDGSSVQASPDATHLYGPYLRAIPPLPVGKYKGQLGIGPSSGPTIGWIYDSANGTIKANTTTEQDARGTLYSAY
jgi:general secretion pathway protein G